jgi:hypothetical protein
LAAFGLYSIGSQLWPSRPVWVVAGITALFCLHLYHQRATLYRCWPQIEAAAHAINQVAPPNCDAYFEYECLYFASNRLPPAGLENSYAALLSLPPRMAEQLHVVSQSEIDTRLAQGKFEVAVLAASNSRIKSLSLRRVYNEEKEITIFNERHYLFWDPVPKTK